MPSRAYTSHVQSGMREVTMATNGATAIERRRAERDERVHAPARQDEAACGASLQGARWDSDLDAVTCEACRQAVACPTSREAERRALARNIADQVYEAWRQALEVRS